MSAIPLSFSIRPAGHTKQRHRRTVNDRLGFGFTITAKGTVDKLFAAEQSETLQLVRIGLTELLSVLGDTLFQTLKHNLQSSGRLSDRSRGPEELRVA